MQPPKRPSYPELNKATISSYFLPGIQPQLSYINTSSQQFVPPPQQFGVMPSPFYMYGQTGGVAVSGTTEMGGGGTNYQNPLFHGQFAFAKNVNNNLPLTQCMHIYIMYNVNFPYFSDCLYLHL